MTLECTGPFSDARNCPIHNPKDLCRNCMDRHKSVVGAMSCRCVCHRGVAYIPDETTISKELLEQIKDSGIKIRKS